MPVLTYVDTRPLILLIEDNPDTRGIYKEVFEREGFQVLSAGDGEAGLRYAQSTDPSIILLDLMVPKISGFDILKRLRLEESTRRIPVMIFSARDIGQEAKRFMSMDHTDYSVKSLHSPKQMVVRVRSLMERSQQQVPAEHPSVLQVGIKENLGNAPHLQSLLGLTNGWNCPACGAIVLLNLISKTTPSPYHEFNAHFACSACRRSY